MLIDDRYPAEHGTDYSEKALIGAGKKKIGESDMSILSLYRLSVNGPFDFRSVTLYGNRSKGIFIYNICRETANYILKTLTGTMDVCLF